MAIMARVKIGRKKTYFGTGQASYQMLGADQSCVISRSERSLILFGRSFLSEHIRKIESKQKLWQWQVGIQLQEDIDKYEAPKVWFGFFVSWYTNFHGLFNVKAILVEEQ